MAGVGAAAGAADAVTGDADAASGVARGVLVVLLDVLTAGGRAGVLTTVWLSRLQPTATAINTMAAAAVEAIFMI